MIGVGITGVFVTGLSLTVGDVQALVDAGTFDETWTALGVVLYNVCKARKQGKAAA